jgi:hypothetical protein
MRTAVFLIVASLTTSPALAAPPEKLYYLGEVKLSSAAGQSMRSQVILLEKIYDRDNSTIVERAIFVEPDGKATERTMRMAVKEDNSFTISDDEKTVDGGGTLFGPAWKWTYFKGTFKTKNGVTIDDENYTADHSVVTGRQKVSTPNGKVIMYTDTTVKAITPKAFEILKAGLMKK